MSSGYAVHRNQDDDDTQGIALTDTSGAVLSGSNAGAAATAAAAPAPAPRRRSSSSDVSDYGAPQHQQPPPSASRKVCGLELPVLVSMACLVAILIVIVALLAAWTAEGYGHEDLLQGSTMDEVNACIDSHAPDTLPQEGRGDKKLGLPGGGTGPDKILLKHCHIWTGLMEDGKQEMQDADILLEGTRISKIGVGLATPAGAQVYDVEGRIVTPGIVDMHSHAGVYGWPEVWAREDGNEMTNPTFPQVRAIDAYDPIDTAIPLILGGGVTTAQILPGSGNCMGGEGFIVKMRGSTVRDAYVPGSPRLLKHALGENPKRVYGSDGKTPMSRMGSAWLMRQKYEAAQKLVHAQEQWCRNPQHRHDEDDEHDGVFNVGADHTPFPTDLALNPLVALLRGKARLHVHGYETQDLEMMMRLSREFHFNISAFHHALEAYMLPDQLKEAGVTIATFSDLWGYKTEAYDASTRGPKILSDAQVPVALKSDHPVLFSRDLIFEAAKAHYYGLPKWTAFAAVTSTSANAIGMLEHVGTLEEGKHGDVVVWDRDPLTIGAKPNMVFVNSELLVNRQIPKVNHPMSDATPRPPLQTSGGPTCVPGGKAANIAITGVTVYHQNPALPADLSNANIIITDGIVTCVGAAASCPVPAGASVYNVDGGFVTPGFIETLSHIGQTEIDAEGSTKDGAISGPGADGSSASVMAYDGIRMNTRHVNSAWMAGVTTAVSQPWGNQLVAGLSVAFHTYGATVQQSLVHPHSALHVNIGQHAKQGGPTNSISGQFNALRQLWRSVNASEPQTRAPADIIAMVKTNKFIPLVVHVDQADAIAAALRFHSHCDCDMIIAGGAEAHVVKDMLKEHDVPVILKARVPPHNFETLRAVDDAIVVLKQAGVKAALAMGDDDNARNLRWEAGIAQTMGLTFEEALASVTSDVADIMGLPSDLGRITVGKKANLVVFDGPPLTLQGHPALVVLGDYADCHTQQR